MLDRGTANQDDYRAQVVAALKTLDSWAERIGELDAEAIAPVKDALFQGGILSKEMLAKINHILTDLTQQTDQQQLEKQSETLQAQIKRAYKQSAELANLPAQETKRTQLIEQQQQTAQQLGELAQQLASEATVTQSLQQLEKQLAQLDNPKGKQQLIEQNLLQQSGVEQQHKTLTVTRIASLGQLEAIASQLEAFEQLDAQIQAQQQLRQTHQAGYLLHVQNQQAAQQLDSLRAENEAAQLAYQQVQSQKG